MQEQFFNGIRFTRTYDTDYFKSLKVTPHGMHRYVWEFYNGPIPEGYEIHHKDGNKANNDISNLACLEQHEHKRLHGRLLTEEAREWKRNHMRTKVIPKAAEWHGSPEGLEWHKKQVETRKDNRRETVCVCQQCGKEFIAYNSHRTPTKFCSGACKQKHLRQTAPKNIRKTCVICGKEFMVDKFHGGVTCSKSCGVALAWKNGKTGKKRKGN